MSISTEPKPDCARGVLLFNLGGPESLDAVRPFLLNLFSDPDIIRIRSDFFRKLLARAIVAVRQRNSRRIYQAIGGGSPLRKTTEAQASAVAIRLNELGSPACVYVGMRCWKPTIEEAWDQIQCDGVSHLVALPLFPQFSLSTTGSCFNYLKQLVAKNELHSKIRIDYIDAWFNHPLYLEAMADSVRDTAQQFTDPNPPNIHLVYSAHSIPLSYVKEGDPYLEQTQKTVEQINARLNHAFPSALAFQSKVGPVKWLEPSTEKVIENLGRAGAKQVLVIPVSFVSDHVETLYEIDIAYKARAAAVGIREFRRAAALNLSAKFIDALAHLALAQWKNS